MILIKILVKIIYGDSLGAVCKESACNAGNLGSIPAGEISLEKEAASHSNIFA